MQCLSNPGGSTARRIRVSKGEPNTACIIRHRKKIVKSFAIFRPSLPQLLEHFHKPSETAPELRPTLWHNCHFPALPPARTGLCGPAPNHSRWPPRPTGFPLAEAALHSLPQLPQSVCGPAERGREGEWEGELSPGERICWMAGTAGDMKNRPGEQAPSRLQCTVCV